MSSPCETPYSFVELPAISGKNDNILMLQIAGSEISFLEKNVTMVSSKRTNFIADTACHNRYYGLRTVLQQRRQLLQCDISATHQKRVQCFQLKENGKESVLNATLRFHRLVQFGDSLTAFPKRRCKSNHIADNDHR